MFNWLKGIFRKIVVAIFGTRVLGKSNLIPLKSVREQYLALPDCLFENNQKPPLRDDNSFGEGGNLTI